MPTHPAILAAKATFDGVDHKPGDYRVLVALRAAPKRALVAHARANRLAHSGTTHQVAMRIFNQWRGL